MRVQVVPDPAKQAADLARYDAIYGAWDRQHDEAVGGTVSKVEPSTADALNVNSAQRQGLCDVEKKR